MEEGPALSEISPLGAGHGSEGDDNEPSAGPEKGGALQPLPVTEDSECPAPGLSEDTSSLLPASRRDSHGKDDEAEGQCPGPSTPDPSPTDAVHALANKPPMTDKASCSPPPFLPGCLLHQEESPSWSSPGLQKGAQNLPRGSDEEVMLASCGFLEQDLQRSSSTLDSCLEQASEQSVPEDASSSEWQRKADSGVASTPCHDKTASKDERVAGCMHTAEEPRGSPRMPDQSPLRPAALEVLHPKCMSSPALEQFPPTKMTAGPADHETSGRDCPGDQGRPSACSDHPVPVERIEGGESASASAPPEQGPSGVGTLSCSSETRLSRCAESMPSTACSSAMTSQESQPLACPSQDTKSPTTELLLDASALTPPPEGRESQEAVHEGFLLPGPRAAMKNNGSSVEDVGPTMLEPAREEKRLDRKRRLSADGPQVGGFAAGVAADEVKVEENEGRRAGADTHVPESKAGHSAAQEHPEEILKEHLESNKRLRGEEERAEEGSQRKQETEERRDTPTEGEEVGGMSERSSLLESTTLPCSESTDLAVSPVAAGASCRASLKHPTSSSASSPEVPALSVSCPAQPSGNSSPGQGGFPSSVSRTSPLSVSVTRDSTPSSPDPLSPPVSGGPPSLALDMVRSCSSVCLVVSEEKPEPSLSPSSCGPSAAPSCAAPASAARRSLHLASASASPPACSSQPSSPCCSPDALSPSSDAAPVTTTSSSEDARPPLELSSRCSSHEPAASLPSDKPSPQQTCRSPQSFCSAVTETPGAGILQKASVGVDTTTVSGPPSARCTDARGDVLPSVETAGARTKPRKAFVSASSSSQSLGRQVANLFADSVFLSDICCKLWFTVPRIYAQPLLSFLTGCIAEAAGGRERMKLNGHIPQDVLFPLTSHGASSGKTCISNHKSFWPFPPTLIKFFPEMKIWAGAQCMGDTVTQNSAQLHWGINLAPGAKAESVNCAGEDFVYFCNRCGDALHCGGDIADPLGLTLNRVRKRYRSLNYQRVTRRNTRKKDRRKAGTSSSYADDDLKGLTGCWGYHKRVAGVYPLTARRFTLACAAYAEDGRQGETGGGSPAGEDASAGSSRPATHREDEAASAHTRGAGQMHSEEHADRTVAADTSRRSSREGGERRGAERGDSPAEVEWRSAKERSVESRTLNGDREEQKKMTGKSQEAVKKTRGRDQHVRREAEHGEDGEEPGGESPHMSTSSGPSTSGLKVELVGNEGSPLPQSAVCSSVCTDSSSVVSRGAGEVESPPRSRPQQDKTGQTNSEEIAGPGYGRPFSWKELFSRYQIDISKELEETWGSFLWLPRIQYHRPRSLYESINYPPGSAVPREVSEASINTAASERQRMMASQEIARRKQSVHHRKEKSSQMAFCDRVEAGTAILPPETRSPAEEEGCSESVVIRKQQTAASRGPRGECGRCDGESTGSRMPDQRLDEKGEDFERAVASKGKVEEGSGEQVMQKGGRGRGLVVAVQQRRGRRTSCNEERGTGGAARKDERSDVSRVGAGQDEEPPLGSGGDSEERSEESRRGKTNAPEKGDEGLQAKEGVDVPEKTEEDGEQRGQAPVEEKKDAWRTEDFRSKAEKKFSWLSPSESSSCAATELMEEEEEETDEKGEVGSSGRRAAEEEEKDQPGEVRRRGAERVKEKGRGMLRKASQRESETKTEEAPAGSTSSKASAPVSEAARRGGEKEGSVSEVASLLGRDDSQEEKKKRLSPGSEWYEMSSGSSSFSSSSSSSSSSCSSSFSFTPDGSSSSMSSSGYSSPSHCVSRSTSCSRKNQRGRPRDSLPGGDNSPCFSPRRCTSCRPCNVSPTVLWSSSASQASSQASPATCAAAVPRPSGPSALPRLSAAVKQPPASASRPQQHPLGRQTARDPTRDSRGSASSSSCSSSSSSSSAALPRHRSFDGVSSASATGEGKERAALRFSKESPGTVHPAAQSHSELASSQNKRGLETAAGLRQKGDRREAGAASGEGKSRSLSYREGEGKVFRGAEAEKTRPTVARIITEEERRTSKRSYREEGCQAGLSKRGGDIDELKCRFPWMFDPEENCIRIQRDVDPFALLRSEPCNTVDTPWMTTGGESCSSSASTGDDLEEDVADNEGGDEEEEEQVRGRRGQETAERRSPAASGDSREVSSGGVEEVSTEEERRGRSCGGAGKRLERQDGETGTEKEAGLSPGTSEDNTQKIRSADDRPRVSGPSSDREQRAYTPSAVAQQKQGLKEKRKKVAYSPPVISMSEFLKLEKKKKNKSADLHSSSCKGGMTKSKKGVKEDHRQSNGKRASLLKERTHRKPHARRGEKEARVREDSKMTGTFLQSSKVDKKAASAVSALLRREEDECLQSFADRKREKTAQGGERDEDAKDDGAKSAVTAMFQQDCVRGKETALSVAGHHSSGMGEIEQEEEEGWKSTAQLSGDEGKLTCACKASSRRKAERHLHECSRSSIGNRQDDDGGQRRGTRRGRGLGVRAGRGRARGREGGGGGKRRVAEDFVERKDANDLGAWSPHSPHLPSSAWRRRASSVRHSTKREEQDHETSQDEYSSARSTVSAQSDHVSSGAEAVATLECQRFWPVLGSYSTCQHFSSISRRLLYRNRLSCSPSGGGETKEDTKKKKRSFPGDWKDEEEEEQQQQRVGGESDGDGGPEGKTKDPVHEDGNGESSHVTEDVSGRCSSIDKQQQAAEKCLASSFSVRYMAKSTSEGVAPSINGPCGQGARGVGGGGEEEEEGEAREESLPHPNVEQESPSSGGDPVHSAGRSASTTTTTRVEEHHSNSSADRARASQHEGHVTGGYGDGEKGQSRRVQERDDPLLGNGKTSGEGCSVSAEEEQEEGLKKNEDEEEHTPVLLGFVLEVFHMPLETQADLEDLLQLLQEEVTFRSKRVSRLGVKTKMLRKERYEGCNDLLRTPPSWAHVPLAGSLRDVKRLYVEQTRETSRACPAEGTIAVSRPVSHSRSGTASIGCSPTKPGLGEGSMQERPLSHHTETAVSLAVEGPREREPHGSVQATPDGRSTERAEPKFVNRMAEEATGGLSTSGQSTEEGHKSKEEGEEDEEEVDLWEVSPVQRGIPPLLVAPPPPHQVIRNRQKKARRQWGGRGDGECRVPSPGELSGEPEGQAEDLSVVKVVTRQQVDEGESFEAGEESTSGTNMEGTCRRTGVSGEFSLSGKLKDKIVKTDAHKILIRDRKKIRLIEDSVGRNTIHKPRPSAPSAGSITGRPARGQAAGGRSGEACSGHSARDGSVGGHEREPGGGGGGEEKGSQRGEDGGAGVLQGVHAQSSSRRADQQSPGGYAACGEVVISSSVSAHSVNSSSSSSEPRPKSSFLDSLLSDSSLFKDDPFSAPCFSERVNSGHSRDSSCQAAASVGSQREHCKDDVNRTNTCSEGLPSAASSTTDTKPFFFDASLASLLSSVTPTVPERRRMPSHLTDRYRSASPMGRERETTGWRGQSEAGRQLPPGERGRDTTGWRGQSEIRRQIPPGERGRETTAWKSQSEAGRQASRGEREKESTGWRGQSEASRQVSSWDRERETTGWRGDSEVGRQVSRGERERETTGWQSQSEAGQHVSSEERERETAGRRGDSEVGRQVSRGERERETTGWNSQSEAGRGFSLREREGDTAGWKSQPDVGQQASVMMPPLLAQSSSGSSSSSCSASSTPYFIPVPVAFHALPTPPLPSCLLPSSCDPSRATSSTPTASSVSPSTAASSSTKIPPPPAPFGWDRGFQLDPRFAYVAPYYYADSKSMQVPQDTSASPSCSRSFHPHSSCDNRDRQSPRFSRGGGWYRGRGSGRGGPHARNSFDGSRRGEGGGRFYDQRPEGRDQGRPRRFSPPWDGPRGDGRGRGGGGGGGDRCNNGGFERFPQHCPRPRHAVASSPFHCADAVDPFTQGSGEKAFCQVPSGQHHNQQRQDEELPSSSSWLSLTFDKSSQREASGWQGDESRSFDAVEQTTKRDVNWDDLRWERNKAILSPHGRRGQFSRFASCSPSSKTTQRNPPSSPPPPQHQHRDAAGGLTSASPSLSAPGASSTTSASCVSPPSSASSSVPSAVSSSCLTGTSSASPTSSTHHSRELSSPSCFSGHSTCPVPRLPPLPCGQHQRPEVSRGRSTGFSESLQTPSATGASSQGNSSQSSGPASQPLSSSPLLLEVQRGEESQRKTNQSFQSASSVGSPKGTQKSPVENTHQRLHEEPSTALVSGRERTERQKEEQRQSSGSPPERGSLEGGARGLMPHPVSDSPAPLSSLAAVVSAEKRYPAPRPCAVATSPEEARCLTSRSSEGAPCRSTDKFEWRRRDSQQLTPLSPGSPDASPSAFSLSREDLPCQAPAQRAASVDPSPSPFPPGVLTGAQREEERLSTPKQPPRERGDRAAAPGSAEEPRRTSEEKELGEDESCPSPSTMIRKSCSLSTSASSLSGSFAASSLSCTSPLSATTEVEGLLSMGTLEAEEEKKKKKTGVEDTGFRHGSAETASERLFATIEEVAREFLRLLPPLVSALKTFNNLLFSPTKVLLSSVEPLIDLALQVTDKEAEHEAFIPKFLEKLTSALQSSPSPVSPLSLVRAGSRKEASDERARVLRDASEAGKAGGCGGDVMVETLNEALASASGAVSEEELKAVIFSFSSYLRDGHGFVLDFQRNVENVVTSLSSAKEDEEEEEEGHVSGGDLSDAVRTARSETPQLLENLIKLQGKVTYIQRKALLHQSKLKEERRRRREKQKHEQQADDDDDGDAGAAIPPTLSSVSLVSPPHDDSLSPESLPPEARPCGHAAQKDEGGRGEEEQKQEAGATGFSDRVTMGDSDQEAGEEQEAPAATRPVLRNENILLQACPPFPQRDDKEAEETAQEELEAVFERGRAESEKEEGERDEQATEARPQEPPDEEAKRRSKASQEEAGLEERLEDTGASTLEASREESLGLGEAASSFPFSLLLSPESGPPSTETRALEWRVVDTSVPSSYSAATFVAPGPSSFDSEDRTVERPRLQKDQIFEAAPSCSEDSQAFLTSSSSGESSWTPSASSWSSSECSCVCGDDATVREGDAEGRRFSTSSGCSKESEETSKQEREVISLEGESRRSSEEAGEDREREVKKTEEEEEENGGAEAWNDRIQKQRSLRLRRESGSSPECKKKRKAVRRRTCVSQKIRCVGDAGRRGRGGRTESGQERHSERSPNKNRRKKVAISVKKSEEPDRLSRLSEQKDSRDERYRKRVQRRLAELREAKQEEEEDDEEEELLINFTKSGRAPCCAVKRTREEDRGRSCVSRTRRSSLPTTPQKAPGLMSRVRKRRTSSSGCPNGDHRISKTNESSESRQEHCRKGEEGVWEDDRSTAGGSRRSDRRGRGRGYCGRRKGGKPEKGRSSRHRSSSGGGYGSRSRPRKKRGSETRSSEDLSMRERDDDSAAEKLVSSASKKERESQEYDEEGCHLIAEELRATWDVLVDEDDDDDEVVLVGAKSQPEVEDEEHGRGRSVAAGRTREAGGGGGGERRRKKEEGGKRAGGRGRGSAPRTEVITLTSPEEIDEQRETRQAGGTRRKIGTRETSRRNGQRMKKYKKKTREEDDRTARVERGAERSVADVVLKQERKAKDEGAGEIFEERDEGPERKEEIESEETSGEGQAEQGKSKESERQGLPVWREAAADISRESEGERETLGEADAVTEQGMIEGTQLGPAREGKGREKMEEVGANEEEEEEIAIPETNEMTASSCSDTQQSKRSDMVVGEGEGEDRTQKKTAEETANEGTSDLMKLVPEDSPLSAREEDSGSLVRSSSLENLLLGEDSRRAAKGDADREEEEEEEEEEGQRERGRREESEGAEVERTPAAISSDEQTGERERVEPLAEQKDKAETSCGDAGFLGIAEEGAQVDGEGAAFLPDEKNLEEERRRDGEDAREPGCDKREQKLTTEEEEEDEKKKKTKKGEEEQRSGSGENQDVLPEGRKPWGQVDGEDDEPTEKLRDHAEEEEEEGIAEGKREVSAESAADERRGGEDEEGERGPKGADEAVDRKQGERGYNIIPPCAHDKAVDDDGGMEHTGNKPSAGSARTPSTTAGRDRRTPLSSSPFPGNESSLGVDEKLHVRDGKSTDEEERAAFPSTEGGDGALASPEPKESAPCSPPSSSLSSDGSVEAQSETRALLFHTPADRKEGSPLAPEKGPAGLEDQRGTLQALDDDEGSQQIDKSISPRGERVGERTEDSEGKKESSPAPASSTTAVAAAVITTASLSMSAPSFSSEETPTIDLQTSGQPRGKTAEELNRREEAVPGRPGSQAPESGESCCAPYERRMKRKILSDGEDDRSSSRNERGTVLDDDCERRSSVRSEGIDAVPLQEKPSEALLVADALSASQEEDRERKTEKERWEKCHSTGPPPSSSPVPDIGSCSQDDSTEREVSESKENKTDQQHRGAPPPVGESGLTAGQARGDGEGEEEEEKEGERKTSRNRKRLRREGSDEGDVVEDSLAPEGSRRTEEGHASKSRKVGGGVTLCQEQTQSDPRTEGSRTASSAPSSMPREERPAVRSSCKGGKKSGETRRETRKKEDSGVVGVGVGVSRKEESDMKKENATERKRVEKRAEEDEEWTKEHVTKEYADDLRKRVSLVLEDLWSWTSEKTRNWSAELDQKPYEREAVRKALRDGFIPYIHTHLASTTAREPHLKHLDMSVPGRKNIPFWGFDAENLAALSSGIGTGYLYYTVFPGSVFPIHCEQGGLGAFNAIVGVLRDHLANMLDIPDDGDDDDDEAVGEQSGSEDEKHSEQRVLAGRETRQDEEEVEKRKRVSSGKEVWKPAMDSGAVLSRVSRDGSKQDDVSRGEHPPRLGGGSAGAGGKEAPCSTRYRTRKESSTEGRENGRDSTFVVLQESSDDSRLSESKAPARKNEMPPRTACLLPSTNDLSGQREVCSDKLSGSDTTKGVGPVREYRKREVSSYNGGSQPTERSPRVAGDREKSERKPTPLAQRPRDDFFLQRTGLQGRLPFMRPVHGADTPSNRRSPSAVSSCRSVSLLPAREGKEKRQTPGDDKPATEGVTRSKDPAVSTSLREKYNVLKPDFIRTRKNSLPEAVYQAARKPQKHNAEKEEGELSEN